MFQPQYFNVHWYGPHSFDDAEVLDDQNLVLYMICGTHGIYGKILPSISARPSAHLTKGWANTNG